MEKYILCKNNFGATFLRCLNNTKYSNKDVWQLLLTRVTIAKTEYRKAWNISRKILKLKWLTSRLTVVFAQSIETRFEVENEDVVGAAPTGDAPTTSEWSTNSLPTKARFI